MNISCSSYKEIPYVFKASLVIIGYDNVHLDDNTESTTVSFNDILENFDLAQHTRGPTHSDEHMLDVFMTHASTALTLSIVRGGL